MRLKSILTKNQKLNFSKSILYENKPCTITVEIRYDDECGNGHNTFTITGRIKNKNNLMLVCGCIHDEIVKYFPEFKHLIKWHLCNSKEPLYYYENTLYFASNSASSKYKAGKPNQWKRVVKFKNSSITHSFSDEFINFLERHKITKDFKVIPIKHETDNYFNAHYTFIGFDNIKWHQCPFDTKIQAEQYAKEFNTKSWTIKKIVTGYQPEKPREFEKARRSAIWFDATDEELSLSTKDLRKLLKMRLPKLMKEFKADIEALGFIY